MTPDIWSLEWLDPRLIPEHQICDNHDRFMSAAEKTYKYLATFNHRPFADWELLRGELERIIMDNAAEGKNSYPRKNVVSRDPELEIEFRLELHEDVLDESAWFREVGIETGGGFPRNSHIAFAGHEIRRLLKLQQLPPVRPGAGFKQSQILSVGARCQGASEGGGFVLSPSFEGAGADTPFPVFLRA